MKWTDVEEIAEQLDKKYTHNKTQYPIKVESLEDERRSNNYLTPQNAVSAAGFNALEFVTNIGFPELARLARTLPELQEDLNSGSLAARASEGGQVYNKPDDKYYGNSDAESNDEYYPKCSERILEAIQSAWLELVS